MGLTPIETTAIFAVFPIVVVAALIFSGDISDYIGRRSTLVIGLSSSLVGTVLFAIAPSVLWVFAGRAFSALVKVFAPAQRPLHCWSSALPGRRHARVPSTPSRKPLGSP
ncbi:MFS transporter [Caballeronia mineralivorans]|uniref:MFS transporter n=1 Tax=Caballeronia mineralivorans TaxID=2010198 RepID=UPI003A599791